MTPNLCLFDDILFLNVKEIVTSGEELPAENGWKMEWNYLIGNHASPPLILHPQYRSPLQMVVYSRHALWCDEKSM